MGETCAESPPALVLQEGVWLPPQSFISARPVFPMMRAPTALVGMSQSPRPLIFNRSKAHPLTRTLQLVNPRHARNSGASWTPAHASPSHPWGPGPGTRMQPSSLNETGRVPRGCRRVGGLGISPGEGGAALLLQDTLLTAESKACARDPNGFAFWGCCVLAPVGAP